MSDKSLLIIHTDINFPAALNASCSFMSPLICASKFGSLDACRLLIQNGAHITKKSCNGQSPLHYAARKGHTKVLEVGAIPILIIKYNNV